MTVQNIVLMPPDQKRGVMCHDYGRGKSARLTLAEARIVQLLIEMYPQPLTLKKLSKLARRRPDPVKVSVRNIRIAMGDDFISRSRQEGYLLNPAGGIDGQG